MGGCKYEVCDIGLCGPRDWVSGRCIRAQGAFVGMAKWGLRSTSLAHGFMAVIDASHFFGTFLTIQDLTSKMHQKSTPLTHTPSGIHKRPEANKRKYQSFTPIHALTAVISTWGCQCVQRPGDTGGPTTTANFADLRRMQPKPRLWFIQISSPFEYLLQELTACNQAVVVMYVLCQSRSR